MEKLISVLTPHDCLVCGLEGQLLCRSCLARTCRPWPPHCFLCLRESPDSAVCAFCQPLTLLNHVWAGTAYSGVAKQLVHVFKFERAQAAAAIMAAYMCHQLPPISADTVVVPVPTATSRQRSRGYDHTRLLAKFLAQHRGLPYSAALGRLGQSRQVGAKRQYRQEQTQGAYRLVKPRAIRHRAVLLVDDVATTGTTLVEAARVLGLGGARQVNAVVFAQTK